MRNLSLWLLFLFPLFKAPAQTKVLVYFKTAESSLLPAASHTLDSLALVLKKAGRYRLTINGYCDSTGLHPDNISLGWHRANSVFEYLNSHGISADSMVRNGYAEANPAARGNDARSLAKNRRAEILISTAFGNSAGFDAGMPLSKLQVGQKLVLKNLNFVGGKAVLLPESEPTLKGLLAYLLANPSLEIKINGHVCCGNDMLLSIGRAKFVYEYLINNGIKEKRLSYEGFSNKYPIAANDLVDEQAARLNRRVEVVIVKK